MNRKIVNPSVDEINTIEIEANSLKDMAKELETLRRTNELLEEDNETLFKTNSMLIEEVRNSKEAYNTLYGELQEAKQELRRLKNPRSCGMCITCIECSQSIGGEF